MEKTCENCAFRDVPATTTVCQTCTAGGVAGSPHWKEIPETDIRQVDIGKRLLTPPKPEKSDGSTAGYYVLPQGAAELQDLISHRDMNAQIGEIFRACYRYGLASHSDRLRDAKKILFYAMAEVDRLEKSHG
jgi:hypothetical protein